MSCNCNNVKKIKERYAGFFSDYKAPSKPERKALKKLKEEAAPNAEETPAYIIKVLWQAFTCVQKYLYNTKIFFFTKKYIKNKMNIYK